MITHINLNYQQRDREVFYRFQFYIDKDAVLIYIKIFFFKKTLNDIQFSGMFMRHNFIKIFYECKINRK